MLKHVVPMKRGGITDVSKQFNLDRLYSNFLKLETLPRTHKRGITYAPFDMSTDDCKYRFV